MQKWSSRGCLASASDDLEKQKEQIEHEQDAIRDEVDSEDDVDEFDDSDDTDDDEDEDDDESGDDTAGPLD